MNCFSASHKCPNK
ncbi:hypothetical protein D910_09635 [Dendroctonus ponderosae]|uniref:Uncharacterized protein n=1 Tax=Dendroctonus ponderosae TaxID=77166 RepID=U4UIS6_DENPD|nr:hypothetical protein D910_09635 [Dendroctonus ponderosae]